MNKLIIAFVAVLFVVGVGVAATNLMTESAHADPPPCDNC